MLASLFLGGCNKVANCEVKLSKYPRNNQVCCSSSRFRIYSFVIVVARTAAKWEQDYDSDK